MALGWKRKMPCVGRDLLSRISSTSLSTCSVSPWNTGLGNFTSVMPRLATVVPIVVSFPDTPIISPSMNGELTSGLPHRLLASNSWSSCRGRGSGGGEGKGGW